MPLPPNFNFLTSILHEPIESTQIHHGDDFHVVEINHKWMFRFPRSQAAPADAAMIERMRLMIQAEPLFDSAYDVQFGYPGRLTHAIREIEACFGR